nr:SIS domain-containing protein [Motilibacter aurantiacus]
METVARICDLLLTCLRNDGKAIFFGNGGSATEAQHLSAELLGRFYLDRPALPSVSLADNTAAMTAIGNDYSYPDVFSRQIVGIGRPGDVAFGLTTSGDSVNVVRALEAAKGNGLLTVAFTGARGGRAAQIAHEAFRAPSEDTPRVQEAHLLVGHTMCEIVEAELFGAAAG